MVLRLAGNSRAGQKPVETAIVIHELHGGIGITLNDWLCSPDNPKILKDVATGLAGERIFLALFRGEEVLVTVSDGMIQTVTALLN